MVFPFAPPFRILLEAILISGKNLSAQTIAKILEDIFSKKKIFVKLKIYEKISKLV